VSAWFASALTVNAQPGGPASDRPDAIAIVNVQVIPMDRERVVPAQTVLVRGGRIEAVGDADRIVVPAGATTIDGAGRYLLPGLTDAHVHLATDMPWAPARADFGDAPLCLASGVTTVINLGGSPRELEWRRRVERGELPGPTIYTSGEFVNEAPMRTPEDVEGAVAAQARDGYELVKFRERPDTTVGLSLSSYLR
jgi:hypothetical protein